MRGRARYPPAANCDHGPDRLDQPERPCALKKSVDGAECTRAREPEYVPRATAFEGVGHEHRGHSGKPE
jgi:hypothetical protein